MAETLTPTKSNGRLWLAGAAWLLALVLAAPGRAQIIADYRGDFTNGANPGTDTADFAALGTGWGYLWNAPQGWMPGGSSGNGDSHPVGTQAHYRPLTWSGTTRGWTADGDQTNGNNQPSGYLRLLRDGSGHPALGSTQTGDVGNRRDRYVIAAYEIRESDGAGTYAITDSSLHADTPNGTPLRVYVHVNDDAPLLNASYPKDGSIRNFDTPLGELQVGDRVYVCVGPDGSAASDSFQDLAFSISHAEPPPPRPEPPPPPPPGGPPLRVEIINPGAETNGGVDRQAVNDPEVPGWSAELDAHVILWDTAGGNGDWRFTFEDGDSLFQLTDHTIAPGEAFSLRFDASSFAGLPESVTAELYVTDGPDTHTAVAERTFHFEPRGHANWQSFQLVSYFGALDDHAGKKLGVQFRGPTSDATRFLSVDDVTLTAYDGVLPPVELTADWTNVPDRVWVGSDLWANRLQDWEVSEGRLECRIADSNKPMRTVHSTVVRLAETPANFSLSVHTGKINAGAITSTAFAGFLVGAGQGLSVRGAALVHHSGGKDGGLLAGIDGAGRPVFRDNSRVGQPTLVAGPAPGSFPADIELRLVATYMGPDYWLDLAVVDATSDTVVSEASLPDVSPLRLVGNTALVSHPGSGGTQARFRFQNWSGSGSKLELDESGRLGPIVSAQHTLSENVLNMTAQMAPFSPTEAASAELEVDDGGWQTAAVAPIDPVAHTATFRVEDWNAAAPVPYRVKLDLRARDGSVSTHFWDGTIRPDPVEKPDLVLAGVNCMTHVIKSGAGAQGVDSGNAVVWTLDYVIFPHDDLTTSIEAHAPDCLFFSGDQIYEGSSPTRADNSSDSNRELDYLYKWFFWCWTFRDLARDIPSVSIPDDHDVYQGNLWGQGGRPIGQQERGGYVRPPRFVKMVERTQTSHLPDPFDPTPVEQGIGVYYSSFKIGRVGFAILEDRKFKNGFQGQPGMPDPVPPANQPLADPDSIDPPGLKLLGDRQLAFLDAWIEDWRGVDMKAALSQTLFAGATTHTGEGFTRRYFDYDSGGWPRSGRHRAVTRIRKAFAPHICGDQHLSLVLRHGIDAFDDAHYAFCLPAGANFFPRAFDPDNPQSGPTAQVRPLLGPYVDGLGNRINMIAVANPASFYTGLSTNRSPRNLHDRAPGYGIVRFDKAARSITFENWPRYADPRDPSTGGQYEGWPVTIQQQDNYAREPVAFLPLIDTGKVQNPVITVIEESSGETVYSLRVQGNRFRPHVFAPGLYTVRVTEPDTGFEQILENQLAGPLGPLFHRGDSNADGEANLADAIFIFSFLFLGGPVPGCLESVDVNNDRAVNITDGIALLTFLFLGGEAPADPGPPPSPCGADIDPPGSPGDLGCESYDRC